MDQHDLDAQEWRDAEARYSYLPKGKPGQLAGAHMRLMEGKRMEASKDLTVTEQPAALLPIADQKRMADNQIELAAHWAKKLMEVVRQCKMSKTVQGKEYLQVEAWLVIAEFAHCRAVAQEAKPWLGADGELLGYTVRAVVLDQNGVEVGAGESSCGFDAFPCRGRKGSEQDKAAKGAAQTWAISRALSNRFRYVALMAGFSPTPAEEMQVPADVPSEKEKLAVAATFPEQPDDWKNDLLYACPIHAERWIEGKWGRYHTTPDKETCSLKKVLGTMIAKYSKQLGINDEIKLQEWLAEHQFSNWKTLSEDEKVQAVEIMKSKVDEKLESDDVNA